MKKSTKRLALYRETVRTLTASQLLQAFGGVPSIAACPTNGSCASCGDSCMTTSQNSPYQTHTCTA